MRGVMHRVRKAVPRWCAHGPPVSGRARAVIMPTLQRVWRPGQGQGQNRPLGQPCRTRLPCFSGRTCNLQNGL